MSAHNHAGDNSITNPTAGEQHSLDRLRWGTLLGKTPTRHSAGDLNWGNIRWGIHPLGNLQIPACWGQAILRSAEERRYYPQTSLQGNIALTALKLAWRILAGEMLTDDDLQNSTTNAPGVHGHDTLKCPQHSK